MSNRILPVQHNTKRTSKVQKCTGYTDSWLLSFPALHAWTKQSKSACVILAACGFSSEAIQGKGQDQTKYHLRGRILDTGKQEIFVFYTNPSDFCQSLIHCKHHRALARLNTFPSADTDGKHTVPGKALPLWLLCQRGYAAYQLHCNFYSNLHNVLMQPLLSQERDGDWYISYLLNSS